MKANRGWRGRFSPLPALPPFAAAPLKIFRLRVGENNDHHKRKVTE
jgi:hypothetical protein